MVYVRHPVVLAGQQTCSNQKPFPISLSHVSADTLPLNFFIGVLKLAPSGVDFRSDQILIVVELWHDLLLPFASHALRNARLQ